MESINASSDILDLRTLISVEYKIVSALGIIEERRFHQHIRAEIFEMSEKGERLRQIGSVSAIKFLISEARNYSVSLLDLFDITSETMDIAERLWDFETGDFDKRLYTHYNEDIEGSDFLVLYDIELLPEFRGRSIGKYLIKDLYNNFITSCGLFVADISSERITENKKHKIVAYLNLLGFEMLPSLSNSLLFINPALINEPMKSIILD